MSKLKLREPIAWKPDGGNDWIWGCVGEHTLFRLLFDDGEWKLSSAVLDFETEFYTDLDQAKARAEELLIEFGEKIFTIDKEQ